MASSSPRVVFDVNVYLAAVVSAPTGHTYPFFGVVPPTTDHAPADCLSLMMDSDRFTVFLSDHILWNIKDKLGQLGWPPTAIADYVQFVVELALASGGSVLADLPRSAFDSPDHEDNLVLDLVAACDAGILVTDDARDLLPLNPWKGRLILSSTAFVRQIVYRR